MGVGRIALAEIIAPRICGARRIARRCLRGAPRRRVERAERLRRRRRVRAELPPVAAARRLVHRRRQRARARRRRVRVLGARRRGGQRVDRRALALAEVGLCTDRVPLAGEEVSVGGGPVHNRVESAQPPLAAGGILPRRRRVALRALDDRVVPVEEDGLRIIAHNCGRIARRIARAAYDGFVQLTSSSSPA